MSPKSVSQSSTAVRTRPPRTFVVHTAPCVLDEHGAILPGTALGRSRMLVRPHDRGADRAKADGGWDARALDTYGATWHDLAGRQQTRRDGSSVIVP